MAYQSPLVVHSAANGYALTFLCTDRSFQFNFYLLPVESRNDPDRGRSSYDEHQWLIQFQVFNLLFCLGPNKSLHQDRLHHHL